MNLRQLTEEIEHLKSSRKSLNARIENSNNRIMLLENPPKYKIGEVVGKYTVVKFDNYTYIKTSHRVYEAIKNGEIVRVAESKLDKICKKLNRDK
jgi:hypothetical protein